MDDAVDCLREPHRGSSRDGSGPYTATATQNGTGWVMRMVAFRAAASSSDTTAPSVPTGLAATAISSSQVNLELGRVDR